MPTGFVENEPRSQLLVECDVHGIVGGDMVIKGWGILFCRVVIN